MGIRKRVKRKEYDGFFYEVKEKDDQVSIISILEKEKEMMRGKNRLKKEKRKGKEKVINWRTD